MLGKSLLALTQCREQGGVAVGGKHPGMSNCDDAGARHIDRRAAVNDSSKVRRNDNAVLTVSSSMLAANELFSYGHRVVFFYCEITVIFLKHRQNRDKIFLKHRQN